MFRMQSKALFYRDWKYSKWFMIPILLELILFFVPDFVNEIGLRGPQVEYAVKTNFYILFYVVLTVTLSLMSITLFYYEKNSSLYPLSASMPFRKIDIIRSKWITGLYNIALPYFTAYILLNAIAVCNFCWRGYFLGLSKWLIISFLTACFIYGIISAAQSLNGSAIFGSLTTLLFVICPLTILYTFFQVFYKHYGLLSPDAISNYDHSAILIPNFLKGLIDSRIIVNAVNGIFSLFNFNTNTMDVPLPSPFNQTDAGFLSRGAFFLFITLIFYHLSVRMFVKSKYEKSGCLMPSTAYERICRIVISYAFGFLALLICSLFYGRKAVFRLDYAINFCIILPVLLYIASGIVFKLYHSRNAGIWGKE